MEEQGHYSMLTTNMHAMACHFVTTEREGGPMYRRKDLYVERFIGILKKGITHRICYEPEKLQSRNYILLQSMFT